jgi:predicted  nucleic acid-binding Zn-ribbon protein
MDLYQENISVKYHISELPGEDLGQKLENVKKSVKEEIRKELKIKEGAENLRKVVTDKKRLSNVNSIVKQANCKLQELQSDLQELDAHILVTAGQGKTGAFRVRKEAMNVGSSGIS